MAFGESRTGYAYHLGTHVMSGRVDYLDRGFTPHLLNVGKQGLRAKFMRPVFPVRSRQWSHYEMLIPFLDIDVPVSSLRFVPFPDF